jgi:sugar phosphate permease
MEDVEKRVIGKVMRRLIPFLIVCYFVAYLDRVNVGFAKLHMNAALGLSEAAFGLGAGLFFIGYFLFAGPYMMGYLKDLTGNFTAGLLLLAGCALVGAVVVVMLRIDARREQLSGEVAMAH